VNKIAVDAKPERGVDGKVMPADGAHAERAVAPVSNKSGLRAAVAVEFRKARSSRVLWSTAVLLAVGVTVLAAAMVLAARSGDPEILAKLGPQAASGDWPAFLSVAVQITSAAGVLAFGVGISWLYGREFADGTIPGLFGLPVSRSAIAGAKLFVYLVWAVVVALVLVLLLLGAGVAVGLGAPDSDTLVGLGRQCALGALTALIAVPCGWAASLGRGLLPGIATAVGILVISQVSVVAGLASWVPFVAPAFWAIHPDASTAVALVVVPAVPVIFGAATVLVWRRLQLDK
jgi:ABC-2 type transport system permease protein